MTFPAKNTSKKKQKLLNRKIEISEKLANFEKKGGNWLETCQKLHFGFKSSTKSGYLQQSSRKSQFSQKSRLEPPFDRPENKIFPARRVGNTRKFACFRRRAAKRRGARRVPKRRKSTTAPELKLSQTFEIILPNLIHKSKKRNLK